LYNPQEFKKESIESFSKDFVLLVSYFRSRCCLASILN
jgi:hypothetical protein